MSKKPISKPKPAAESEFVRLEKVFKLMAAHGVGELELEDDQGRIHVRLGSTSAPVYTSAPTASAREKSEKKTPDVSLSTNHKQVISPFVGTFYRASGPNTDVYVKEGQTVKKGQTLCIVEAMKLMNEIESEFNGKIVSCLVENGQPVEFGEPLFVIET